MDSGRDDALWYSETLHTRLEHPMRSLLPSFPIAAATWLLLTAACTVVRTVQRTDLSPPNPRTRVWVTRADRSTVVFDSARVSGDSLIGMVDGQPQRLRLSEATVLRVREPAPDRTEALVYVGVAGVAVYGFHLLLQSKPPQGPCVEYCVPEKACCP